MFIGYTIVGARVTAQLKPLPQFNLNIIYFTLASTFTKKGHFLQFLELHPRSMPSDGKNQSSKTAKGSPLLIISSSAYELWLLGTKIHCPFYEAWTRVSDCLFLADHL